MKIPILLKAASSAAFALITISPGQSSENTPNHSVMYVRSATLANLKVNKRVNTASNVPLSEAESLEQCRQLSYSPVTQPKAIEKLTLLLKRNPNNWPARYSRALTLAWMKRFSESFEDFRKILAVQPNLSIDVQEDGRKQLPVQVAFAEALVWSGSVEEAESVYERYLSQHPEDRLARFNFALALRTVPQQRAASIEQFDICIRQAPDFEQAIMSKAVTLAWMKQYDLALAILSPFKTKDLLIASDEIRVSLAIAQLYNWSGRTAEAAAAYKEYLSRYPKDNVAKVEYAEVLSTLPEQREEALAMFSNQIANHPEDSKARIGKAQTLAWLGRKDESIAEYRMAVANAPDDVSARTQYASYLMTEHFNSEALIQLSEAERLAPADIEIQNLKAQCLVNLGEFVTAERMFRDIASNNPQDFTARVGLAEALYQLDRNAEGDEQFRSALLLPHTSTQVEATAQRLSDNPDLDSLKVILAQDALNTALRTTPGNTRGDARSLTKLGESLIYSDATRAEGITCLTRALELDADNRIAKALLAEALSWGKEKKLSLAMFRELTSTDPTDLNLRSKQAAVLSWTGKLKLARKEYSEILSADPNNRLALLGLGHCYSWQGDYFKAEDILSKVDRKYPRDPEIVVARALNYRDMGRVDLAEEQLDSFDAVEKLASKKTSLSMKQRRVADPNNRTQ